MKNILVYILLTAILVVNLFGINFSGGQTLGADQEGDSNFTNVKTSGYISASGTLNITGAQSFAGNTGLSGITFDTNGENITDFDCFATSSWNVPSLLPNTSYASGSATTSINVASASLNQLPTSSSAGVDLFVSSNVSSTIPVKFFAQLTGNDGLTASTTIWAQAASDVSLGEVTLEICYLRH